MSKFIMTKVENAKKLESGSYRSRTIQHPNIILTREAKQRLKWFLYYQKHNNARLTCRHFGISPDTFYLWKKRFNPSIPQTLEDDKKNRRPKTTRTPKYTNDVIDLIKKLKKINPRVGKILITKALTEKGLKISSSTVGRILKTIRPTNTDNLQS